MPSIQGCPLDKLTAFQARGWELVVSGLNDEALARARASISAVTAIGNGRFALEIPLTTAPERLIPELVAAGAQLVSLNPIRATLEDYFVATVQSVRDERDGDRRGGLADRAAS